MKHSEQSFRNLLLQLEEDIDENEQRKFVFLLGDLIPKRIRKESLTTIFECLIERGKIGPNDCSLLLKYFETLKLQKVAFKVARFSETTSDIPINESNESQSENLHGNFAVRHTEDVSCSSVAKKSLRFEDLIEDFQLDDEISFFDSDNRLSLESGCSDIDSPNSSEQLNKNFGYSHVDDEDLTNFQNNSWSDEFLSKIGVRVRPNKIEEELARRSFSQESSLIFLECGSEKTTIAGKETTVKFDFRSNFEFF